MPLYEYTNSAGELFEITGSMKQPPPELLIVRPDRKSWRKAIAENEGHDDADIFRRVYTNPGIKMVEHGVNYKIPASRSLPRRKGGTPDKLYGEDVRRHKDGGYSLPDGRPIVRNRADADREMKRNGRGRL